MGYLFFFFFFFFFSFFFAVPIFFVVDLFVRTVVHSNHLDVEIAFIIQCYSPHAKSVASFTVPHSELLPEIRV